jgi:dihydroorotate dehydrogenase
VTLYHHLFDRVLVHTDAETAHHAAFTAIRAAGVPGRGWSRLRSTTGALRSTTEGLSSGVETTHRVMGLDFPGLLGVAAGFDKNATAIDGLAALGFGFVEVGTVTGEPQPGNPRPRLVRLPADLAVVNRMGFNNDGAEVVARRLASRRTRPRSTLGSRVPLGINIGKTKVVPEDAAVGDYEKSTGLLAPHADYLVVNVSSPNTPGLRDLQSVAKLEPLLRAVRRRADDVTDRHVPLLVKIAPDLDDADVLAVADLAMDLSLDGIVATNTTIAREGLASAPRDVEAAGGGGLSGAPLRARADEVVRLLRQRVGPDLVLIGVGGLSTPDDAVARLEAGADLLQGYTGFVYEGPWWPRRMNRGIDHHLDRTRPRGADA